jgi:preprotein translocase subunit SecD
VTRRLGLWRVDHERNKALKNLSWRLTVIAAVIVAAVIYVIPTFQPGVWPHKKINLGLDLQGGMHLVLEVDADKAVENTIERVGQEMRQLLKKERIRTLGIERVETSGWPSGWPTRTTPSASINCWTKNSAIFGLRTGPLWDNGVTEIVLDIPDTESDHIRKLAVDQALETIRNRIDQFGVSEPDIRIQGERRILIQLPGIKDTQRAKELIGKTALLEFKLLDEEHDVDAALGGNVPASSEILYESKEDPATRRVQKIPFLVKKRTSLTGAYLTDARVQIDSQYNEPYVSITFDKKGARLFERITADNVKKRLAIVLDDNVYSAPVIQEKIAGGEARITGNFTTEEARDLAIVLACRRAAGTGPDPGRTNRRPLPGNRLHPHGPAVHVCGRHPGDPVHGDILQRIRRRGRFCPDAQHPAHRRRAGRIRCHADPARHRRHHPDHRHGGGCQRLDLRTNTRRNESG